MEQVLLIISVVAICLIAFFVAKKAITKDQKKARETILRFKFFLHPNAITIWGGIVSVAGLGLYLLGHTNWGIALYIVGAFADMFDGMVAREAQLVTPLGKALDPFMDKIKYFLPLIYFANEEVLSWELVLILILIDSVGQYLRNAMRLIRKVGLRFVVAANSFGKTKTILALVLVVYCFLLKQNVDIPNIANYALSAVVLLAISSVVTKFTTDKKMQSA